MVVHKKRTHEVATEIKLHGTMIDELMIVREEAVMLAINVEVVAVVAVSKATGKKVGEVAIKAIGKKAREGATKATGNKRDFPKEAVNKIRQIIDVAVTKKTVVKEAVVNVVVKAAVEEVTEMIISVRKSTKIRTTPRRIH